jgi:hypothetical protein
MTASQEEREMKGGGGGSSIKTGLRVINWI